MVQPYGPTFSQALARLAKDPTVQIGECSTSMEAVALARKLELGVVLFHVAVPDDLTKHVTMLKMLAVLVKKKRIRLVVTTKVRSDQVQSALAYYGCNEILMEPVPEKSIFFKVDRQVKLIQQLLQKERKPAAAAAADEDPAKTGEAAPAHPKAYGRGSAAKASKKKFSVFRRAALGVRSDCWLANEAESKRIRGRWIVRLLGPGSDCGRWVRVKEVKDQVPLWQWSPIGAADDVSFGQFVNIEEGTWFFRGARPELQDLEWVFVAENPELTFRKGNELIGTKMSADANGDLILAQDSAAGQALRPKLEESLSKTISTRKLKLANAEPSETADGDAAGALKKRRRGFGGSGENEGNEERPSQSEFREGPPLSLASDCWLFMGKRPRRVAAQWMIKLVGPSSAAGRWMQAESTNPAVEFWNWVPTDPEKDAFIKEPGSWVFRGMMPRFQEDLWLLVGDAPELAFYHENASKGAKLSMDAQGNLIGAADSAAAEAHLPAIEESLRRVIRTKAGAEEKGEDGNLSRLSEGVEEDDEEASAGAVRRARASEGDEGGAETEQAEVLLTEEAAAVATDAAVEAGANAATVPGQAAASLASAAATASATPTSTPTPAPALTDAAVATGAAPPTAASAENTAQKESAVSKETTSSAEAPGAAAIAAPATITGERGALSSAATPAAGDPLIVIKRDDVEAREYSGQIKKDKESAELSATQAAPAAGKVLEFRDSNSEGSALEGQFSTEPTDAKGIRASVPPGPTLSPMALAFLMSELVRHSSTEFDAARIASRYCAYVAASCGGLKVELWSVQGGQWQRLGSSEMEGNPRYHEAVSAFEGEAGFHAAKEDGGQTLVVPIRFGQPTLGALAIGGEGAEGVKLDYARAAARFAIGLLRAVSQAA